MIDVDDIPPDGTPELREWAAEQVGLPLGLAPRLRGEHVGELLADARGLVAGFAPPRAPGFDGGVKEPWPPPRRDFVRALIAEARECGGEVEITVEI